MCCTFRGVTVLRLVFSKKNKHNNNNNKHKKFNKKRERLENPIKTLFSPVAITALCAHALFAKFANPEFFVHNPTAQVGLTDKLRVEYNSETISNRIRFGVLAQ